MRDKMLLRILTVVMALVLACCIFGCGETEKEELAVPATEAEITEAPTEPQPANQIYFNVDKLLNKELVRTKDRATGMYQVRLFINGEYEVFETDLDAAVQSVDRFYLSVPEFDYRGMFSGVRSAQSQLGGSVFDGLVVTDISGNVLSVKSSAGSITLAEAATVYDMTGLSAPVGTEGQVQVGDKLCAYADSEGLTQLVFIIERPQFHDDSHTCAHCAQAPSWTAWDGTQPLTSGHYVMTGNVTLEDTITLSGEDVALCLNGYTLSCANRVFVMTNGARLSVTDHAGYTQVFKGSIAGAGIPAGGKDEKELLGGTIYAEAGTELNLYGGELRSNLKEGSGRTIYRGTTVYTCGTFNLHDGVLTGGIAANCGGGLYLGPGGTFNMDGGTMRYGNAGNSGGTAAFDKDAEAVNITGGKIVAGVATKFGGGIYTEKSMEVTGGTFCGDLSDGVNAEYGGVFCVSNGAEVEFKGNVEFYGGSANEGGNLSCRIRCHVTLGEGVVLRDGYGKNCGGNVVNFGHLDIRGARIENGYATSGGGNLYIYSNGDTVVNLYEGEITGGRGGNGGNIRLAGNPGSYEKGSVMHILGGTISDGEATSTSGGNINITGHSEVYMTGGTVTNGKAKKDGGGVCLNYTAEYQTAARLFVGGSAKITGNEGSDVFVGSLTAVEFVKDVPLTAEAKIGLSAADPTAVIGVDAPEGAETVCYWKEGIRTIVNEDGSLMAQ